jgi:hypothetical protein
LLLELCLRTHNSFIEIKPNYVSNTRFAFNLFVGEIAKKAALLPDVKVSFDLAHYTRGFLNLACNKKTMF